MVAMLVFSLSTTYPEDAKSVRPKFVHLLNKELVKLRIKVNAIVPHYVGSKTTYLLNNVNVNQFRYLPKKYELNKLSIPDELKQSKFGFLKIGIMLFFFFVKTLTLGIKQDPDILHGQWAFPCGFIAFVVSKILRKASISTIHFAEIPLLQKFKLIRKIVIFSLNHSSQVIAVSEFTKANLIKLGVKQEIIRVIRPVPNFIPLPKNKYLIKEFKKKFSHDDDEKIILFVGRLVERKGIKYLIRAVKNINYPKIRVIIAGSGPVLEQLKQLTQDLSLESKVSFFGSPMDDQLSYLYVISDVFVFPSIVDSYGETEGLGLAAVEAIAAGIPVVATKVGGLPEAIIDGENGLLVEPKNEFQIAKAVDQILTNDDLKNKLKNSQDTLSDFLPRKIAMNHIEIYKNVLKK